MYRGCSTKLIQSLILLGSIFQDTFTPKPYELGPFTFSMCHMSHVTCHVSCVTCHESHVQKKINISLFSSYFFAQIGGASRVCYKCYRCYQWGLPCLVISGQTNLLKFVEHFDSETNSCLKKRAIFYYENANLSTPNFFHPMFVLLDGILQ